MFFKQPYFLIKRKTDSWQGAKFLQNSFQLYMAASHIFQSSAWIIFTPHRNGTLSNNFIEKMLFEKKGHSRRLSRVFFRTQNRVCGVLVLKGSKILQYLAFLLFQAFVYEICKKWLGGRRCFIGLLAGNRKIETFICLLSQGAMSQKASSFHSTPLYENTRPILYV